MSTVDEVLSRHCYTDTDGTFWAAGYQSNHWYGGVYKRISDSDMRAKVARELAVVNE